MTAGPAEAAAMTAALQAAIPGAPISAEAEISDLASVADKQALATVIGEVIAKVTGDTVMADQPRHPDSQQYQPHPDGFGQRQIMTQPPEMLLSRQGPAIEDSAEVGP